MNLLKFIPYFVNVFQIQMLVSDLSSIVENEQQTGFVGNSCIAVGAEKIDFDLLA